MLEKKHELIRQPRSTGAALAAAGVLLFTVLCGSAAAQELLFAALDQAEVEKVLSLQELQIENDWEPLTLRRNYVQLNSDALQTPAWKSFDVEMNLFSDTTYTATLFAAQDRGFMTWKGSIQGRPGSRVILVEDSVVASLTTAMAGFVRLPGEVYQIRKVGTGRATSTLFAVEEMDRSLPWTDVVVSTSTPGSGARSGSDLTAGAAAAPAKAGDRATKAFEWIDVMIVYTLEAEVAWGGAGDALAYIIVDDMNDVLFNNFLTQTMYLAHSQRVEADLTGSPEFDLENLIANTEVQELRDAYAADLVQLAVEPGWSYVGGIASQLASASDSGFASRAYSIFAVDLLYDGVALHEMGHNMGAAHHEADGGPTGAFSYSRGYKSATDGIRTLMAYPCPPDFCDVVPYFSTPDVTYLGDPIGNSSHDNARTIDNTAGLVEGFRDLPTVALVSVSKIGSGTGVVTSSPGDVDCGTECEDYLPIGDDVTLTATPDPDSNFVEWSGDCGGTDPDYTFTLFSDRFCTAHFTSVGTDWQLTVTKTGSGDGTVASDPPGIQCGPGCSQDSASFADGTPVELSASPDGSSQFSHWGGDDCSGTNPTTTVTMTADRSCSAHFTSGPSHELTVQKLGGGTGRVVSSPPGIDCDGSCNQQTASFAQDTTVTLTATEDPGSTFVEWSGACNGTSPVTTVTMTADKTCQAEFAALPMRTLTVSVVTFPGQGTPSVEIAPPGTFCETECSESLPIGTSVTLTAHDDGNLEFVRWLGDCLGTNPVVSFTLDDDRSCIAQFRCDGTIPQCTGGP